LVRSDPDPVRNVIPDSGPGSETESDLFDMKMCVFFVNLGGGSFLLDYTHFLRKSKNMLKIIHVVILCNLKILQPSILDPDQERPGQLDPEPDPFSDKIIPDPHH
jgi:hypothetical protein